MAANQAVRTTRTQRPARKTASVWSSFGHCFAKS